MNMPEMNGAELLAQVQSRWPNTVRVMLTGNRAQDVAVRALNQGMFFGSATNHARSTQC